jgi:hypothetical protein
LTVSDAIIVMLYNIKYQAENENVEELQKLELLEIGNAYIMIASNSISINITLI